MRSQPLEVPDPRKEVECVTADKKAHKRDIGDAFDRGAQGVIRQSGPENREHLPKETHSNQECAEKCELRQLQFKGDSLKACALHANPRCEVGPSLSSAGTPTITDVPKMQREKSMHVRSRP